MNYNVQYIPKLIVAPGAAGRPKLHFTGNAHNIKAIAFNTILN